MNRKKSLDESFFKKKITILFKNKKIYKYIIVFLNV